MGRVLITGGGGTDVSDTTATASDVRASEVFIDANGDETVGTLPNSGIIADYGGSIPKYTDSGNTTLNAATTSKSYPAGYYPNAHGAIVNVYDGT